MVLFQKLEEKLESVAREVAIERSVTRIARNAVRPAFSFFSSKCRTCLPGYVPFLHFKKPRDFEEEDVNFKIDSGRGDEKCCVNWKMNPGVTSNGLLTNPHI